MIYRIRLPIVLFSLILIVLALWYLGLSSYSAKQSAKLHTYIFTKDNLDIPQEGLSLSISISKQWEDLSLHPEIPAGAQYDGILYNESNYLFKDWTLSMRFSESLKIDSSWNGIFSNEGNTLEFISTGTTAEIVPNSHASFGAVLYAVKLMELTDYTLTGYRLIPLSSLIPFYIFIAASALWGISLFVYILVRWRMDRYRKRQKLDSEIILQSMNTLTSFIDAKDAYTKGHSSRVAEYSAEIARRMKIAEDMVAQIYYIALMHDCGKIGIPDSVLKKPGKLDTEEYNLIKSHTVTGDELLVNFTAIQGIRDGAHYHHERYDGTGYPSGLAGTQIPLCARIICVADSFDAMSSNRCYRGSLCLPNIVQELQENAGKQFDPTIVPLMIELIEDGFVEKIQQDYPLTEPIYTSP